MKHLKKFKECWIFESSELEEREDTINQILLLELPDGLEYNISKIRKDVELEPDRYVGKKRTDLYLEIYINRPWGSENRHIPGVVNPPDGYPGNLIFWYEIKEAVGRIVRWYYSEVNYEPISKDTVYRTEKDLSPLRFFGSGIEMFVGFNKREDFEKVGDFISFTNFRIMIKL